MVNTADPASSQPARAKRTDHYDDPGYTYDAYWEGREYEHAAEKMAITKLLAGKHFKQAIDIGGGYGRLTPVLTEYADAVALIDPSHKQLQLADKFLADYPGITRRQMAADKLDYADSSIDLVVLVRVMHHLPEPMPELNEIARVLALGGYAVIEAANYAHGRNRLRHLLHHKKMPLQPVDIRSEINREKDEVPFVNHNPRTLVRQLSSAGLKVERILSVSNLRSTGLKRLLPPSVMLAIEGILQPTLAHGYFGPSVFFLVRKEG